jgi:hypothetical protein
LTETAKHAEVHRIPSEAVRTTADQLVRLRTNEKSQRPRKEDRGRSMGRQESQQAVQKSGAPVTTSTQPAFHNPPAREFAPFQCPGREKRCQSWAQKRETNGTKPQCGGGRTSELYRAKMKSQ